jgi:hypothetical protein
MHALVEEVLGFEAENGEDDSARVHGREGVADGDLSTLLNFIAD